MKSAALHEGHAALGLQAAEQRGGVDVLGQLDPQEVAALGQHEARVVAEVLAQRLGDRVATRRAARP